MELLQITLVHLVALLIVSWGGAMVVGWVIKYFPDSGLPLGYIQAGATIGYLERILVYIFLTMNMSSLIGFLLTAKAVYRFGDIQGDNNMKMRISEYFIIGTMTSLLWSVVVFIAVRNLIRWSGI